LPQPVFLLPTLLLIFFAWRRQSKRLVCANSFIFVVMLLLLGEYSASRPALSQTTDPIRVLSYNIRYGSGGVEALAQVIKSQNADIICLQEVIAKDEWPDPLPQLQKHFPGYHIARYGQLVTLSRFPIIKSQSHSLPRRDGCGFLETQLKAFGSELFVYNAHFINPIDGKLREWPRQIPKRARIRKDQLALLKRLVAGRTHYLAAGDFNTPPRGALNRALLGVGQDAYAQSAVGLGYTFPAALPLMRIDRIFSSFSLEARRSSVVATSVSDHRPLVADFVIAK
jgi:vancomycin resistance protein VanJ